ncbi:MAG: NlpC/P60 family protein [Erysipelotrichaceae bacterium]|nr:NlpC/P60 family protein [Erysipelotrichaceae bacterium]
MDKKIKSLVLDNLYEHVIKRKAMFIPLLCISTFGLVGFVAIDKEAPTIEANSIEVLYGTALDKTMFNISDNRTSLDALDVDIDDSHYTADQLGTYTVDVTATDIFNNSCTKTVQVEVVDKTAPMLSVNADNEGYVINVGVNDSSDITQYLSATDNVDGDVTTFIETDKELDTSELGTQDITVSVSDASGNTTEKTFEFVVKDTVAPTITLTDGSSIDIDYGSDFDYTDYFTASDNYDESVTVDVDSTVNTSEEGTTTLTITATDSSNNQTTETLNVVVKDISAPTIKLSKSKLTLTVGDSFTASKYLKSATDNKDGDLTSDVEISSNVKTSTAGTYSVTYTVSDEAGNTTSKTLKVTVNSKSTSASGVVATALSKVGIGKYASGCTGPTYFDCSGFVYWSFKQNGISIPRSAAAQYSATTRVSKSDLQPGDLVFFKNTAGHSGISHVGIYIGNGQFVHCGSSAYGVVVRNLNTSYWISHWAGGGRV